VRGNKRVVLALLCAIGVASSRHPTGAEIFPGGAKPLYVPLVIGIATTQLATPTATATLGLVPTTDGPTVAPPTETATPEGDLVLRGSVYDARLGPGVPVSDAMVTLMSCFPRRYSTMTQADGHYKLIVPAAYVTPCTEVTVEVWKEGYAPDCVVYLVADLRMLSTLDVGLLPAD